MYLGLGAGYKISPKVYSGTGQATTELDDTMSGMIQVEYKPTTKAGIVFRYEFLNYSAPTTPDIKANNFGTYFTIYF
ncbi:MAG: hypothetical protein Q9M44_00535 [Ghiorsea sp.]|nr:hypothetical protein [Ghiorsea sp.]